MNTPAQKLTTDVRVLASDVEELIKATAAQSGEKLTAARARMQTAVTNATDAVVIRGKDAAEAANRYVYDNPWTAAGVFAAIGFVAGFLIGRR
jgi:ElaB/YqjD/DUF883 family membrane-anchored ribosome-binding protein